MAVEPNTAEPRAADPNTAVLSATVLNAKDANDLKNLKSTSAPKPISGIRMYLSDPRSGRLMTDSVTGSDGSYYLGDVQPGQYVLRVDAKTLAKQYELAEQERMIEVKATKEEFMEISLPDFVATLRSEAKKPGDSLRKGKNEKDLKTAPGQKP